MNISKLFEMQRELDEHIIKEKHLEGQNLLPNTILALQVELGELANEWRGFKHWSNDQEMRREKALEEYVDCLHFFLSIAHQCGYKADDLYSYEDTLEGDAVYIFNEMFLHVGRLAFIGDERMRKTMFRSVLYIFFNFGEQKLGFSWEEVVKAYLDKNAVNHQRQMNGY